PPPACAVTSWPAARDPTATARSRPPLADGTPPPENGRPTGRECPRRNEETARDAHSRPGLQGRSPRLSRGPWTSSRGRVLPPRCQPAQSARARQLGRCAWSQTLGESSRSPTDRTPARKFQGEKRTCS